ncbi:MAG TPA: hypothetical protein VMH05_24235 [Bryobacteraceae bacterium]|nr:hypothetical protein [Bryobacteraceae bacterium]
MDKIALDLRTAVLAADHAGAQRLAAEYTKALTEFWEALPEPARVSSTLATQANELLTWARGMTIVQRAILGEQLAVLEKSMRYATDQAAKQQSSIHISL